MRTEIQTVADDIRRSLDMLAQHMDLKNAERQLEAMNIQAEDPALWDDPAKAQKLMQERATLERRVQGYREQTSALEEATGLIELAEADGDTALIAEGEEALLALSTRVRRLELESLLSGEADANDCFLEVHAGAGGTESQDWAEILLRMYMRWADAHGYATSLVEESPGEEAGIKSATIRVSGLNAYGWLKTENGVHRLVRISPFDGQSRRHTSFSSVTVYPSVDDAIEVEILDKDLRVDTYRASGAGGQHVNKTDSAVRMTHIPTGIVVQCQNDRSQHKNRANAMKMLRARLYELELRRREEAAQGQYDAKTEIGWGHQIRSYVLQPYQMVKDLRTGVEKGNAQGVLDGDIDDYLEAALAMQHQRGAAGE